MPHIGMFCAKDVLSDSRNCAVLSKIASLCGTLCALPLLNCEKTPIFDVLIINDPHESVGRVSLVMLPSSFILINSDRNDYTSVRRYSGRLITYGLNQKACITASSIIGDESGGQMQVCIQRGFPTATGETAAVQEFPVHMHALGVDATIAMVGVLLVCGITACEIIEVFNPA